MRSQISGKRKRITFFVDFNSRAETCDAFSLLRGGSTSALLHFGEPYGLCYTHAIFNCVEPRLKRN